MRYSMGGAAKALGLHKATVARHIKTGKLSAERCEDGTYSIDPAELARVYGRIDPATGAAMSPSDTPLPHKETVETLRDGSGIDPSAELVAELRATVADLRTRLNRSEETVTRLLLALPTLTAAVGSSHPPEEDAVRPQTVLLSRTQRRGFWARFLG